MTVYELAERITVAEIDEWMQLMRVESEERDRKERIARVERQAQQNRGKA